MGSVVPFTKPILRNQKSSSKSPERPDNEMAEVEAQLAHIRPQYNKQQPRGAVRPKTANVRGGMDIEHVTNIKKTTAKE